MQPLLFWKQCLLRLPFWTRIGIGSQVLAVSSLSLWSISSELVALSSL